MNTSTQSFLALPPEIRDLIYQYATEETLPWPESFTEKYGDIPKPCHLASLQQVWELEGNPIDPLLVNYPSSPPRPTWLSLLRCCRTTHSDMKHLFPLTDPTSQMSPRCDPDHATAHLLLTLTSTTSTITWLSLRCHPLHLKVLHIKLHLSDLWAADLTSGHPQTENRIIHALFLLLRQFFTFGPHLSREAEILTPIRLKTVVLSLEAGPHSEESCRNTDRLLQRFLFSEGHANQQMATIAGVLVIWLQRFASSGLLCGYVEELHLDCTNLVEEHGDDAKFPILEPRPGWTMCKEIFATLGYEWTTNF